MHPRDVDGMANSIDPDQTASSELKLVTPLTLFAELFPFLISGIDIVSAL